MDEWTTRKKVRKKIVAQIKMKMSEEWTEICFQNIFWFANNFVEHFSHDQPPGPMWMEWLSFWTDQISSVLISTSRTEFSSDF